MKWLLFLLTCICLNADPLFDEQNRPSEELLSLLMITETHHNGTYKSILAATKQKWIQQSKERWEFDPLYAQKTNDIIHIAKNLGYLDEVRAKKMSYEHGVVLGSLQSNVTSRLNYLVSEWDRGVRFKHLVFLTGERKLDPKREPLALHPSNPRSEAEMVALLYSEADLPKEMREIPVTIVDAPAAPGRTRATTASTILKWVNGKPEPGLCLFVSSQPFVHYQDTVLKAFLSDELEGETIGFKSSIQPSSQLILDTVGKTIAWRHPPSLD